MNYLGHLYLSNNQHELMLNNLFGDFVKGKDLSRFSEKVQKGLNLHREIDTFIDHHPLVIELMHLLYEDLPKVSGIAVDLFFDHLLAKFWNEFHHLSLDDYLNLFYNSINTKHHYYSDEFRFMIEKMIEINWISYYPLLDGLDKMCNGVSQRISFENELKNGKDIFLKHESKIEEVFREYMRDAKVKFNIQ